MSTNLLAPPRPAPRAPRKRRSLEQPYPLFGFRQEIYRFPLADRHSDIHDWLLRQDDEYPGEPWADRWQRCQHQQRSMFKELWVVYLPRPSRWLKPGRYVLDPLTDFLSIPGSPPASVIDCYQQAFAELPRHRFVYLDLLWEPTHGGWGLVSIGTLQTRLSTVQQQFKRRLRHDRMLIEAAQQRQMAMIARLDPRRVARSNIPLPSTPAEARRILGLSQQTLERQIRSQLGLVEFVKYDPMIVFEEPALAKRAGGYMPLGLVAHWD